MNPNGAEIIVVDDDPGDLELIKEAFAGEPVTLKTFERAEAALDYLAAERVAPPRRLVLLDLNMPGLDGWGMLERMRAEPGLARIPVIIFTTSDSPADVLRCYALHANAFITKPDEFSRYRTIARRIGDFWFGTATLPG